MLKLEKSPRDPAQVRIGYHILLGMLLMLFIIQPLAVEKILGVSLVAIIYMLTVVGSLYAISAHRTIFLAGLVLALPAVWQWVLPNKDEEAILFSQACAGAFYLLMIVVLLRRIFTTQAIGWATVSAALCVYLMLGLIWEDFYRILLALDYAPEHPVFSGFEYPAAGKQRYEELFYFSFVTLTTLGYGDITPASPSARALAMLEAIVGQIYLVVMVARVVGLHVAFSVRPTPEPGAREDS